MRHSYRAFPRAIGRWKPQVSNPFSSKKSFHLSVSPRSSHPLLENDGDSVYDPSGRSATDHSPRAALPPLPYFATRFPFCPPRSLSGSTLGVTLSRGLFASTSYWSMPVRRFPIPAPPTPIGKSLPSSLASSLIVPRCQQRPFLAPRVRRVLIGQRQPIASRFWRPPLQSVNPPPSARLLSCRVPVSATTSPDRFPHPVHIVL